MALEFFAWESHSVPPSSPQTTGWFVIKPCQCVSRTYKGFPEKSWVVLPSNTKELLQHWPRHCKNMCFQLLGSVTKSENKDQVLTYFFFYPYPFKNSIIILLLHVIPCNQAIVPRNLSYANIEYFLQNSNVLQICLVEQKVFPLVSFGILILMVFRQRASDKTIVFVSTWWWRCIPSFA